MRGEVHVSVPLVITQRLGIYRCRLRIDCDFPALHLGQRELLPGLLMRLMNLQKCATTAGSSGGCMCCAEKMQILSKEGELRNILHLVMDGLTLYLSPEQCLSPKKMK